MKRIVILWVAVVLLLSIGGGLVAWKGGYLPILALPGPAQQDDHGDDHAGHDHGDDDHAAHSDENMVVISPTAAQNLGLRVEKVTVGPYYSHATMPGEVVEIPGRSNLTISAPVGGKVTRILVDAGQLVSVGDPLFEMQVIDESLVSAQVALLDVLGQLDIASAEQERLGPLADSGAVSGRVQLEAEYTRKRLNLQREARLQELILRGLSQTQVDQLLETRQLVQQVNVPLDIDWRGAIPEVEFSDQQELRSLPVRFTVESIDVHPGMTLERGQPLARMADHRWLYVRGEAFPQDVKSLYHAQEKDWTVQAEFGHTHGDDQTEDASEHNDDTQQSLKLAYIDNHVDERTGTFFFYSWLPNEVASDKLLVADSLARQWKYKPGERVHLEVPLQRWTDRLKVPLAAVVEEGAETFVFRRYSHGPWDKTLEFEQIPVHVIHRDARFALIEPGGKLRAGNEIAWNNAYQLQLTMKLKSGEGGGGHGHGHDH
ncbi:MAG: HlyD family efflux transporter periplasmic adaptor subunit [Pirellulaceae bacterium]